MGDLSEMSVSEPLGATPKGGAFPLATPALGEGSSLLARCGWLGLGGSLVTGLVISLSAGQTDLLLPSSARPVPSWLAGPFSGTGLDLGLGALIAVLVLMFVS